MVTEHQVIAIIATQTNVVGEASVPSAAQLTDTVTAIESTGLVDLVVVSGTSQELLAVALQLGAVNHQFDCIGDGVEARLDLVATLIDGVETFIDPETWVLMVDAAADSSQTAKLVGQSIRVAQQSQHSAGVHASDDSNLMLFKAGSFDRKGSLPVAGSTAIREV